jgi:serine protease Do
MQDKKIFFLATFFGFVGGICGVGAMWVVFASGYAPQSFAPFERARGLASVPATAPAPTLPIHDASDEEAVRAVKAVSPAVVSIIISKERPTNKGSASFPFHYFFDNDDPFGFPEAPAAPKKKPSSSDAPQEKQEVGGGTGFIVSADGLIITNRHVVEDATAEYTVIFADGARMPATVVDTDAFADVGVLRVDKNGLPTVQFGDSSAIQIGQTVIAIGNALSEFRNTVTKGVVSGINRRITAGDDFGASEVIEEAIQTDAAINFGNSGGPLIDLAGKVIGMNTAVSGSGEGIGFALPANVVQKIVRSVVAHGKIIRPRLGVQYVLITPALAAEKGIDIDRGALIVRGETVTDLAVIPGSPADKAGLQENDIILSVDGVDILPEHSLGGMIVKHEPGDMIRLRLLRKGEEKEVTVTLDAWEEKENT